MAENQSIAIELNGVSKSFDKKRAVDNVSIAIKRGEIVSLIGPNGAGKSTVINMITGLLAPDTGTIRIFGREVGAQLKQFKMGVLLQDTKLFPRLTVREYFQFYQAIYEQPADIWMIIQMLDMTDYLDTQVGKLSGGWNQRLALGLTLVNDPEIIVLDEPTVGLDPIIRRELWAIIRNLKKTGKTVLLTTHYMDEAVSLADQVFMLSNGKLIYNGSPEPVKDFGRKLEGGLDEAFENYASGVFS